MYPILSLIFIIFLGVTHAQMDPRKRITSDSAEEYTGMSEVPDVSCRGALCLKRAAPSSQEEPMVGPFWANRGKKDPNYFDDRLIVEEPHWISVRDESAPTPFFTSRGKKTKFSGRQPRRFSDDSDVNDPAFFAARGKKKQE